jgi:hypothetical protein
MGRPTDWILMTLFWRRSVKLFTLLGLIPFLYGCAGIVFLGTGTETYGPHVTLHGYRFLTKSLSPQRVSKQDVLEEWGEPDHKREKGEFEVWRYKDIPEQMSWTGVFLGLVVPLPLVVPTGYYETSMTFAGDILVDSERTHKTAAGFLCGVITPDGMRPFCGASWGHSGGVLYNMRE